MIEIDKVQRDQITTILQNLNIDRTDKATLVQLMRVLGFQADVVFAKSLFSDKIATIYRQHQGEYQKFLAMETVTQLPYKSRCLLFTVFRRYSQNKIKLQCQKRIEMDKGIGSLAMPDSNNIEQIIEFQKKMYQTLKHLIPKRQPQLNPLFSFPRMQSNHSELATFRFNPYSADNNLRNIDHQYLSSLHNPLLPEFNNRSFIAPSTYEPHQKSSEFFSLRSEPYAHNDQLFTKLSYIDPRKQLQNSGQFERKNSGSLNLQRSYMMKEQEASLKGFTAYSYAELGGMPGKKIKKDSFVPVYTPENITRVNEEIQEYKRSLQRNADKKVKAEKDSAMCELNIKHSISQYLSDDRPQSTLKKQNKQ